MNDLWLNWLFQCRINKENEGVFHGDGLDFNVPLSLFDFSSPSLEGSNFEVYILYYPDTNEIGVDLWNNEEGVCLSDTLERPLLRFPCSYDAFTCRLQSLTGDAVSAWSKKEQ